MNLSHYKNDITISALVDTGAPYCVFTRAVAEALEIDMGRGRGEDRPIHILGGERRGRIASVTFDLPPFDGMSWDAEASFLYDDLPTAFAGVLGHEGFLDRWVASFNYYGGYFVIEEHDSFVARFGVDTFEVHQSGFDSEWAPPGGGRSEF